MTNNKNVQAVENKEVRAVIDTLALSINKDNLVDITLLDKENKEKLKEWNKAINYGKSTIKSDDVYLVIKLHNLFKDSEDKEHYIKSYKQYKELLRMLLSKLTVKNYNEIDIVRRDIAIDFNFDYVTNFKKSLYLFDLLTVNTTPNKKWFTTNLGTLEPNSIKLDTSKFQISFYNKEEESHSKAEYKTRYEFRFKARKGIDIDKSINDLIKKIEDLPSKVNLVNEKMIDRLIKHYIIKKAKRPKLTFSSFVDEYDRFIYNREILQALYKKSGLKGSFNVWLKKYKQTRNDNFILLSNREIISRFGIVEEMKRALKEYKRI